jgi:hypothetical protein
VGQNSLTLPSILTCSLAGGGLNEASMSTHYDTRVKEDAVRKGCVY